MPYHVFSSWKVLDISSYYLCPFLNLFYPLQEEDIPELEIDIDELLDLSDSEQRLKLHVSVNYFATTLTCH